MIWVKLNLSYRNKTTSNNNVCSSVFLRSTHSTCVMRVLSKRPLMWLSVWCPNTLRRPSSSAPCTPSLWSPSSSVWPRYSRYSADGSVISTTNDSFYTQVKQPGENIWLYFCRFFSSDSLLAANREYHLWSFVSEPASPKYPPGVSASTVVFQMSVGLSNGLVWSWRPENIWLLGCELKDRCHLTSCCCWICLQKLDVNWGACGAGTSSQKVWIASDSSTRDSYTFHCVVTSGPFRPFAPSTQKQHSTRKTETPHLPPINLTRPRRLKLAETSPQRKFYSYKML